MEKVVYKLAGQNEVVLQGADVQLLFHRVAVDQGHSQTLGVLKQLDTYQKNGEHKQGRYKNQQGHIEEIAMRFGKLAYLHKKALLPFEQYVLISMSRAGVGRKKRPASGGETDLCTRAREMRRFPA